MSAALSRIAQVAMHTFQRNADTMVAGFLVRNPDIKPEDVELVMSSGPDGMRFSIEPKELHVPPVMEAKVEHEFMDYSDGWNDCRVAMLEAVKKARPSDAMVATLDSMTDAILSAAVPDAGQPTHTEPVVPTHGAGPFIANLKHAIQNYETFTIGGGTCSRSELAELLQVLEKAYG